MIWMLPTCDLLLSASVMEFLKVKLLSAPCVVLMVISSRDIKKKSHCFMTVHKVYCLCLHTLHSTTAHTSSSSWEHYPDCIAGVISYASMVWWGESGPLSV